MDTNLVPKMQIYKNGNKKRFTDDQVKSLEVTYSSEARPQSQTLHQIACQLGLQPRQVAVWFQNRRARCKSKQIEHDCSILKARYNSLASMFQSLKKENQSLIIEVQRLRELQQKLWEHTDNSEPAISSGNEGTSSLNLQWMHTVPQDNNIDNELLPEAKIESLTYLEEPYNLVSLRKIRTPDGLLTSSQDCHDLEATSLTDGSVALSGGN